MLNLANTFSKKFLNNLARETSFIQREGSLTTESFISLCAFNEDPLCETSLSKLSSILSAENNIKISPQGLNERFNKNAVEFLKSVMKKILIKQNNILSKNHLEFQKLFNRINVTDSTSFKISDNLNEGKKYSQVDMLEKVKDHEPGQILDIPDACIGANKKLKTRLIITKLPEENKRKRELKNKDKSKRYKSSQILNF